MTAQRARPDAPGPDNNWAAEHVARLLDSLERLTGRNLVAGEVDARLRAQAVWNGQFALLSHGLETDPIFNYGNQTALRLFELPWQAFVLTASRESAEPGAQAAREQFMREVLDQGYSTGYSGVRVSASGRRFVIEDATVWNVIDAAGRLHGQAACFEHWREA